jgi:hypothetical protein
MRTLRTAVAAFALLLPATLASAADSKEAPKTAPAKPAKKAAPKTKAKGKEVTATPAPAPATPGQAK